MVQCCHKLPKTEKLPERLKFTGPLLLWLQFFRQMTCYVTRDVNFYAFM